MIHPGFRYRTDTPCREKIGKRVLTGLNGFVRVEERRGRRQNRGLSMRGGVWGMTGEGRRATGRGASCLPTTSGSILCNTGQVRRRIMPN